MKKVLIMAISFYCTSLFAQPELSLSTTLPNTATVNSVDGTIQYCASSASSYGRYNNTVSLQININTTPYRFGVIAWVDGSNEPVFSTSILAGVMPGYNWGNSSNTPTSGQFSTYWTAPPLSSSVTSTSVVRYNMRGYYLLSATGSWQQTTNIITFELKPSPVLLPESNVSLLENRGVKYFCDNLSQQLTISSNSNYSNPDSYDWNYWTSGNNFSLISTTQSAAFSSFTATNLGWYNCIARYNNGCLLNSANIINNLNSTNGGESLNKRWGSWAPITKTVNYRNLTSSTPITGLLSGTSGTFPCGTLPDLSFRSNLSSGQTGVNYYSSYIWYYTKIDPSTLTTSALLYALNNNPIDFQNITNSNFPTNPAPLTATNQLVPSPLILNQSYDGYFVCRTFNGYADPTGNCPILMYTGKIKINCCDETCNWNINGNSNIDDAINFIGPKNGADFIVKTGNVASGATYPLTEKIRIKGDDGSLFIYNIPDAPTSSGTYHPLWIDNNGKVWKNNQYAYRTSNPNTSTPTQKQFDELNEKVKQLETQLAELLKTNKQFAELNVSESKLMQNTPNPFNSVTKIEYVVTGDNNNYIAINSFEGKPIKTVKLTGKGRGVIELNAGSLPTGTYTYSLYANGVLVDTKLMVISK